MNDQHQNDSEQTRLRNARLAALSQFEELLEPVVAVLGFVWLLLLVVELVWGSNTFLAAIIWAIWGIFLIDFAIRFVLAPNKGRYVTRNWLTAVSLLVPALRFLRVVRVFRLFYLTRAARGAQVIRVVSSINRGIRSLRGHMQRRGIGYVVILTVIVVFVGAAAIYSFEGQASGGAIGDYWDALYWSAMMLTTLGSEYWPATGEGRVITFLLALYALSMFGYITATLATFFIGRETESEESELSAVQSIRELRTEIEKLREQIEQMSKE